MKPTKARPEPQRIRVRPPDGARAESDGVPVGADGLELPERDALALIESKGWIRLDAEGPEKER